MKGRVAMLRSECGVGPIVGQELHHVEMALLARKKQTCLAILVSDVCERGVLLEELLDQLDVALHTTTQELMLWSVPVFVFFVLLLPVHLHFLFEPLSRGFIVHIHLDALLELAVLVEVRLARRTLVLWSPTYPLARRLLAGSTLPTKCRRLSFFAAWTSCRLVRLLVGRIWCGGGLGFTHRGIRPLLLHFGRSGGRGGDGE
mmetsp:Transcript_2949/g.7487  ORF Transcript_2949/g.7487 Transcript_2949/m.7487 type:complete len:202 (-) Transcript_2949:2-607(-)